MSRKWLNLFLRFSGYIFSLKQKIVEAKSWPRALPYVFLLLLAELAFLIVSLPLYLIVSPKKLQESGFIFPTKEKEPAHFHVYVVRRKISLTTVFSAVGIFLLKFIFIGLVSTYLLGAQALLAATQDWNFNTPSDYTYDNAKIEVTGGVAQLKPTITTTSGATTNPGFTTNTTGWTYADWDQGSGEVNIDGARQTNGGNPGGWIRIRVPAGSSDELGGYYRQGFATTVANPTTSVSFDWQASEYDSTPNPITFKLYVFVDTGTGVPIIGQEVWSSPAITGTSGWASVSNLDVSSKVTAIGTYYLKVAMWIETAATNGGPYSVGYDNVQLNWTKSTTSYDSGKPSIYPNASLSPVGVTSWNSFTETATKNGGEINYQLSSDDGATWKYWNGSAWATASTSANSNTASVINANITSFSTAAGKIKWKAFLVSNGSQQVILDNVSVSYTQNAPPSVQNLAAAQNTSSGYVHVNYNLQDNNSDPISLANYEYSLTGAFAGEQAAMTPAVADPAHNGITGLSSSPAGVAHTFVWNAKADLGNIYSSTVYVRLRANDGIANSEFAVSPAISMDYVNPVASNVTAIQMSGSSNIQIGYDLSDNTANTILVELQVSSNGGSTWAVPAVSVSGDVGASVTSGNGKSIVWQAGTDFANQEQGNMMVRVRAKDKYQNQGSYVNSTSFVLDNRAPVIATPADLLAQPLAGAATMLVGGSFAEGNPNTNNFYVAINGGGYGPAAAGDADTATPSDKSVSVGATLKGNDYISAVKIEHTDDFGWMTANGNSSPNSAYKYVKPYTPPPPAISNSGESSLDVTINKHSSEADGLEYAVFEGTQSLYVQSDGSLGSDRYWQAVGAVTVTGLSQPISQYNFQVKSRNTSDASHAISSESDFSSGASSDYQSPQIVINSVAQTLDGTKYVVINYTGTDYQNQTNDLVKYEYSLNGTDWQTMTEKSGVGSDGVAGLAFTSGGASLVFAWDVGTDLPGVEDSAVYVRLESNDSVTNSNIAVSSAFVVNTAGPVVSNIQASQTPATNNVAITYDLADGAGANNVVVLSVSDDSGATYAVLAPSVSGDVGNGITAGLARSIVWNTGIDFTGQEKSTMRVKIAATDSYGNEGGPVESSDFSVDTKAPVISDVVAAQSSGSALVAVTYNLADLSPANVEFEVSSDSGATWSVTASTYTGDVGSGQIAGAKTFNWNAAVDFPDQELATMRIRVRALDSFDHQGAYRESADFSVNTKMLSISDITASQTLGAKTVIIHYDLNKTATISLDISSDGGVTWDVATTTLTGHVNTAVSAGNNKTITWDPAIDFNNEEKTSMRVRLSGTDSFGTVSAYYESTNFSVDTAAPLGLLSLSKFASTNDSVTMNWSSGITDAHFSRYELWHGADQNDVINRSGTAQKWSVADDAGLDSLTTISTVIAGVNLNSAYFVKIWAIDEYDSEATLAELNVFSAPTSAGGGGGTAANIDTTPPGKPILSPLASPTRITSIDISGLAEAGSTIVLYDNGVLVQRLDKTADENGRFSQTFNFSEGQHILTVKAVDSSVNVSEPSDAVSLNIITKTPEVLIVLSPQNNDRVADGTPTLIGVAGSLAPIEIVLDGKDNFTVKADATGAWQFKLPTDSALKDGIHTFVLTAKDSAGNKSAETVLVLNKVALPVEVRLITPTPLPPIGSVRETTGAVELPGIPLPEVTSVNAVVNNDIFAFTGKALPNQEVLVYIHSDQALIYRTKADANGIWQINHSQNEVELAPGEHTIYAVAVDPSAEVKSKPSPVSVFIVEKNFWVSLFDRLNLQTTIITLVAVLLLMFWLYRIKRREAAKA